jgi:hypothetical protein
MTSSTKSSKSSLKLDSDESKKVAGTGDSDKKPLASSPESQKVKIIIHHKKAETLESTADSKSKDKVEAEEIDEKPVEGEVQKDEDPVIAEEAVKTYGELPEEKQMSPREKKLTEQEKKRIDFNKEHPYGVTLLARDNQNNRRLGLGPPFGTIDVAESVCAYNGAVCPHYNYKKDCTKEGSKETPIHMLIASYRDRLCGRTLHNAFSHAENPKRLFIRVIDQTQKDSDLEDDVGCWEMYCSRYNKKCKEYEGQVKIVKVDSSLSTGPTGARSKLSAMIHWDYIHRDEPINLNLKSVNLQDFCMQIDSHMDFSDNFDTGLIEMHHRTQNDYSVLSTYVTDIAANNQNQRTVPNLCMVEFTSSIRNWGTKECKFLIQPKMTNAMWGAGLSFHRCHGELAVPVDPYLDGVFDGEEGSRGIRFFTHGYDVYTPDVVLVTHDYKTHQGNPVVHTWGRTHRHELKENEEEDGMKIESDPCQWTAKIEKERPNLGVFGTNRVNMLLGIGSHHNSTEHERIELDLIRTSRFGLGTKRTMQQVRSFTGINLLTKKMESNECGNKIWVPFKHSPDYGVPEILARGNIGKVVEHAITEEPEKVVAHEKKEREPENERSNTKNRSMKKGVKKKPLKMEMSHGKDLHYNSHVKDKTPRPLLANARPQLRRAGEFLKKEEKKLEEIFVKEHSHDYKSISGIALIFILVALKLVKTTSKRKYDKKKS